MYLFVQLKISIYSSKNLFYCMIQYFYFFLKQICSSGTGLVPVVVFITLCFTLLSMAMVGCMNLLTCPTYLHAFLHNNSFVIFQILLQYNFTLGSDNTCNVQWFLQLKTTSSPFKNSLHFKTGIDNTTLLFSI